MKAYFQNVGTFKHTFLRSITWLTILYWPELSTHTEVPLLKHKHTHTHSSGNLVTAVLSFWLNLCSLTFSHILCIGTHAHTHTHTIETSSCQHTHIWVSSVCVYSSFLTEATISLYPRTSMWECLLDFDFFLQHVSIPESKTQNFSSKTKQKITYCSTAAIFKPFLRGFVLTTLI